MNPKIAGMKAANRGVMPKLILVGRASSRAALLPTKQRLAGTLAPPPPHRSDILFGQTVSHATSGID